MGSALGRIDSSSQTMHICLIGLDCAGKSTALYRMKLDQYINTVPTIGFNCEKIKLASKGISFLIWDVGGQEKIRSLWKSYWRCTDGIIFVIDSSDIERMEEAKMELFKTIKCPDNQNTPVLILANKQDLPSAKDVFELEKILALNELSPGARYPVNHSSSFHSDPIAAEQQMPSKWYIQLCCAVTGEGLHEGLEILYEMIMKKRKLQKQKKKK